MTDKRSDERRRLVSLADALFEDLLSTSDEDLLAETIEAGGDPAAIADEMRSQFEKIAIQVRKERMEIAKAGLRSTRATQPSARVVDIASARDALRQAFTEDGVSMAARNETESDLTDEEVLRKYNDLIRLGVIDPDEEN